MKISLIGQEEVDKQIKNAQRVMMGVSSDFIGVVEYVENRIGLNARKNVYSYRGSGTYRRTGRLLGGRGDGRNGGLPSVTKVNAGHYVVEANPKLKGATFNYAPAVEYGTGWMKNVGARPFMKPSFDEGQAKIDSILKNANRKLNG